MHGALNSIFIMSGPTISMHSKLDVITLKNSRLKFIRLALVMETDDIEYIYANVWKFPSLTTQTAYKRHAGSLRLIIFWVFII